MNELKEKTLYIFIMSSQKEAKKYVDNISALYNIVPDIYPSRILVLNSESRKVRVILL